MEKNILHCENCLNTMKRMADNSIDAIVTDPPYGLKFMGKKWDYSVPSVEIWKECLRVLKHGGHLLAFAGTRTQHRMAVNIEDAGFEIRDMITQLYDTNEPFKDFMNSLSKDQQKLLSKFASADGLLGWGYGSGFPKSLDISKSIDKQAGAERHGTGEMKRGGNRAARGGDELVGSSSIEEKKWKETTKPTTPEAQKHEGWGTALKPALEPITVARKPLSEKTVAANVLKWGTGGINIDGCRIEVDNEEPNIRNNESRGGKATKYTGLTYNNGVQGGERGRGSTLQKGRFPSNLIHDGSDEVETLFPDTHGAGNKSESVFKRKQKNVFGKYNPTKSNPKINGDMGGSASRFFYTAKTSKSDRHDAGAFNLFEQREPTNNNHPTVKPTSLMRYLCRLVTPVGGLVYDPFTGSGSTWKAAILEGFEFIGSELDQDYVDIANKRVKPLF